MVCHTSRPAGFIVHYAFGVLHSLQVEHLSAPLFWSKSTAVFSGSSRALQRLSVAEIPLAERYTYCLALLCFAAAFVTPCAYKRCRNVKDSVSVTDFCPEL